MKETKNIYKIYAAWEFERERQDLEAQSQKGWQVRVNRSARKGVAVNQGRSVPQQICL